ncbi:MAG: hypothetical protein J6M02_02655 [Clostridia bacterium]|nr:hypothetical protein [Clostridia bacterium]
MKIFWFSRHTMTPAQLADLKRIYGADLEVAQASASVSSAKEVVELAGDADVLAVVLPPALLADLTNPRINTKPVIRAVANRIPTGGTVVNPATGKEEAEYRFEHAGWEKVIRIVVETERL